jgi:antitoxin component YwqK of YwqJK toxin-antitoxin module
MAPRALFPSSICFLFMLLVSCSINKNEVVIPGVFVRASDTGFVQRQGYLYYQDKKFCGRMIELYSNGDTALSYSYYNGKEEGWSRKWYDNKQLAEARLYHTGKKEGIHQGWWPNGKQKFEYHFLNGEHEGEAKEWFSTGKLFRVFHYKQGQENGRQQMWWEDGRVRANYVVRDGQQYGLIGRKLCVNYDSTSNH